MEKKNSNIIIRKDGLEYVGYVSDVKAHVISEIQTRLNGWVLLANTEDPLVKDTEQLMYLAKDLMGYGNPDNVLIKATKDTGDYGYWYVSYVC